MAGQDAPVSIQVGYSPLPKQIEFHENPAKYRFFGGGWGNGKTTAGCVEALALALEYPGSTGLIARKTRPELKATTQHSFFEGGNSGRPGDWAGCPREIISSFNKSEQLLTLVNGSTIHFWPLDDPAKLTNLNLGWFLIDQGEEVQEEMFQMLEGRLRQMGAPRKGMVLFNPAGHDWIWKRCVLRQFPDHKLVHAKTSDNPNLPPDYVDALMNMPEAWRKRFMEGSFDVFEGQIWPEFDPDIHIINPIRTEPWYELVETIDHGRRAPTAVLWAAFDEKGNCFIVDEHYEAGRLVGHHAETIHKRRETWGAPLWTVIDASAAQQDPNTGRSVMDEYYDHGIVTIPSDRHVVARINRVAEWLRRDPMHPHPVTNEVSEEGWPRLYICKNCVHLIEHIQQYQWKKQPVTREEDPKEQPLEKDDHDVDAMGYLLMSRPPPGSRPYERDNESPYWARVRKRREEAGGSHGGRRRTSHALLGSEF